jgi:type IV pilus assembly protein PilN
MIRINLLPSERKAIKKKVVFKIGQQITAICGAILVAAAATVGWRLWVIRQDTARIEAEVTDAQKETARLHSVIAQMQQFEQRKAQLQQRVTLIEQLRQDQIGPVHMLDQISLALPPSVWLTEIRQAAAVNEVLIEGRSMSLTGLSDFVANLERSGYFQRSVEIVNSTTDASTPQGEIIRFQVKAVFKAPGAPSTVAAADAAKDASSQLKPKG